jgi:4-hydroxy-4-methyl-2-oxoglutarate aldolase
MPAACSRAWMPRCKKKANEHHEHTEPARRRQTQHRARRQGSAVETNSPSSVSATIHEAMGRVGLMKPYMRPIYMPARSRCGTAVTVLLHPGDNWMMHVVAEQIQPGDVVVAAITAETPTASLATCWPPRSRPAARAGLVIDAGVRDVKTSPR